MLRQTLLAFSCLPLALTACSQGETPKVATQALDPVAVHENVLTLDSHIDLELEYIAEDMDPWTNKDGKISVQKMQDGGLDAAFMIVYTPQGEMNDAGVAKAREIAETRYKAIMRLTEKYADQLALARTAKEVRAIHQSGKKAILLGMENAFPLGNSIDDLAMWEKRGVRYLGITHMGHNQFADSSNPSYSRGETKALYGGLSPLGKELVVALNKAGIMVDVSHTSKDTMMQAVALSKVPVIASHSGVKALVDNPRNLDDEQLKALAAKGGVIQIVAYGGYLKNLTPEQQAFKMKVRKEMGLEDDMAFLSMDEETEALFDKKMEAAKALGPAANVGDLVDHIDYVVKLVGIDHVGIASDFDGGGKIEGWWDVSETPNVTKELVKRGYSQADIEKIWGGNLLRVLAAVQAHAHP